MSGHASLLSICGAAAEELERDCGGGNGEVK